MIRALFFQLGVYLPERRKPLGIYIPRPANHDPTEKPSPRPRQRRPRPRLDQLNDRQDLQRQVHPTKQVNPTKPAHNRDLPTFAIKPVKPDSTLGKMFGLGNKRPVPRPKPDPSLLLAASDRRKPERGKFADGNQVKNC